jgi:hypothetical protein
MGDRGAWAKFIKLSEKRFRIGGPAKTAGAPSS